MKQKIIKIFTCIRDMSVLVKIPLFTFIILISICIFVFNMEKAVTFSYKSETCVPQIIFLPSVSKTISSNKGFEVNFEKIFKVGGFELISFSACFDPIAAPKVGDYKISVSPFGGGLLKKKFSLYTPKPPVVSAQILDKPISIVKPLILPLSGDDSIYNYKLELDDISTKCPVDNSAINCDVSSLNLSHGKDYVASLTRMYAQNDIEVIVNKTIKTIDATTITKASIIENQIIYDKTKEFIFEFDKQISKINAKLDLIKDSENIPAEISIKIDGTSVKVTSLNDLVRNSKYRLRINDLLSDDGSTLVQDYEVIFEVSGGPKVMGVNSAAVGLPQNHSIIITFDQKLDQRQNIKDFIEVTGLYNLVINKKSDQITISYNNAPMCTEIKIKILSGIKSEIGIANDDGWSFSTKTLCHTASVIGYSVGGNPITAYIFGNGTKSVLYTGSIHGNEKSTYYLMNDWINELELNANKIQSDKKIIVIPTLNPDGLFASSRNNINNVDLNRNFPTADWQSDVYGPDNKLVTGGGGKTSLSEPESQAIANYMDQINPMLVLSYHSTANCVIANDAGNSVELASTYANLSGYRNTTGESGTFSYEITGTYDTWLYEKKSIPSLIIELSSISSSQFNRNKDALWAMANK